MTLLMMLLIYIWLIYPATLIVLNKTKLLTNKSNPKTENRENSDISIVIPVYNSASNIQKKVENCLTLQYDKKINIIIVSDGSDDDTTTIIKKHYNNKVKLIELRTRKGKSYAQNTGIDAAETDIILLTDVDSILKENAINIMLCAYNSDTNISCVGGKIEFQSPNLFQKTYWWLENKIRQAESNLGMLTSISGAAILIEKQSFKTLDEDTGDDLVIPLDLKIDNKKTIYTEETIVYDRLARHKKDILNSRRRITRRNSLAIYRRKQLLNPIKHTKTSISLLSRKILRWLTPLLLLGFISCLLFKIQSLAGFSLIFVIIIFLLASKKTTSLIMEGLGLILGVIDFSRGIKTKFY